MQHAALIGSLIALSCLLGCSDDGDDDDAASGGAATCADFCARTLDCAEDPLDDCLSSCTLAQTLCPTESAAALECVKAKPDSDLHCDADTQLTTLNDGVCAAEQDELLTCAGDADL